MIEVLYTCVGCKQHLTSPAGHRGRRCSCPVCGMGLVVPVQGGVVAVLPPLPKYPEENYAPYPEVPSLQPFFALVGFFLMGMGVGALAAATLMAGRG